MTYIYTIHLFGLTQYSTSIIGVRDITNHMRPIPTAKPRYSSAK